jgi:hypothetical protein
MCRLQVTVDAATKEDVAEARRRLEDMESAAVTVTFMRPKRNSKSVVAHIDHKSLPHEQMRAAAWAKDGFGMHPRMAPSVVLLG